MTAMTEDNGFDAIIELGVAIPVADMERALDFYCDFLGFEFLNEEDQGGDERRIVTLRYGNILLDLVSGDAAGPSRQNFRLFWTVGKLGDALEHIQAGGGTILRTMEYGVYCTDPDGNTILVKILPEDAATVQEMFF